MISLDQYIANTSGKGIDYDGAYGVQCVDNAKKYLRDCYGLNPGSWGDAHAYFNSPNAALLARFDRIPKDHNIPRRGDLVVWSSTLPNSGGGGHIAICLSADTNSFVSYDQNWAGKFCHQVIHNYSYVIGFLRPKSLTPAPPPTSNVNTGANEMISNADQAIKIYKLLRPNGSPSQEEVNGTAGKRSFAGFLNDAQGEMTARDANLKRQSEQLAAMSTQINAQNKAITELTLKLQSSEATNLEKQKALNEAMAKITDANAEMTTSHDKITDLQATLPTAGEPKKPSVFVRLLAAFIRRKK